MQVFAGVACAVLAWPALRALASRVIWRVYPAFGLQLAGVLALYAAIVAVAVVFLPTEVLAGVGAAAVTAIVGVAWLSRPTARRRDGLPAGSMWPPLLT